MGLPVWRDISLLWLILLTLVAVLPFGVLFFFAIRGLHRLRQIAKEYLPIAQDRARQVADGTDRVGLRVTSPVIAVRAKKAEIEGVTKAIVREVTSIGRKKT